MIKSLFCAILASSEREPLHNQEPLRCLDNFVKDLRNMFSDTLPSLWCSAQTWLTYKYLEKNSYTSTNADKKNDPNKTQIRVKVENVTQI